MPVQRTELRDELTALIAAGRELSPDHDELLAEVFLDRLTTKPVSPSRARRVLSVARKPRHLLAVILGLTVLGAAAVQPFNQTGSSNVVVQPAFGKCVSMKQHPACGPAFKAVRVQPSKAQVVPVAPKAPAAPQEPGPKSGS